MKNFRDIPFTSPNGIVKQECNKQSFVVKRTPIGEKFLMDDPLYTFTMQGPIEFEEYVVIEYDCFGIKRTPDVYRGPFMSRKKGDEIVTLFRFDDMTIDKKSHSIIVKAPEGSFESITMSFRVDRILEAYFNITKLYTCKKDELPVSCEKAVTCQTNNFTPIDISAKFDTEYSIEEFESVNDAGLFFNKENVSLYGIPFNVKTDGKNLIAPPPPPKENDEIIENFGKKCKRRICRAVSRDGETVIDIGKKASEIYFILTLSGKRHIRALYGSDPTILGQSSCDLNEPFKVFDVEYFMTEVVYKDGRRDTHLPLNLCTGRHGISGDVSVYAVPCDGEVESLIIHNRNLDTDVNLAAVTVNETDVRLYPDMLIPENDEKIIAIANIGLWNGRRSGYKLMGYNLNNILDYFSCDYIKVYADRYNIHSEASHHDGTHYVTFRMIKPNLSDEQVENFLNKVYNGTHTKRDITKYTSSLVKEVNKVYGW